VSLALLVPLHDQSTVRVSSVVNVSRDSVNGQVVPDKETEQLIGESALDGVAIPKNARNSSGNIWTNSCTEARLLDKPHTRLLVGNIR
jgi:hypothetical protein